MTLNEYLHNPSDYNIGVQLYNAHFGIGQWERKYTARATPKFLMANLLYALKKLSAAGKQVSIADVSPTKSHSIAAKAHNIEPKAPNIEAIPSETPIQTFSSDRAGKELEARSLYARLGNRRADLFSNEKEVRRMAALSIKADGKKNRLLRDEINYYDKHGHWPSKDNTISEVDISTLGIKELISLKKNLAPWCSKEKGKIEKETDAVKKADRLKTLESKQALLARVNEKIDQM